MKSLKWMQAIALSLMVVMVVTACGNSGNSGSSNGGSAVKISLLNSKGEIQAQLEEAAKVFKEDNPNITLEIIG